jgi:hypothetical protein
MLQYLFCLSPLSMVFLRCMVESGASRRLLVLLEFGGAASERETPPSKLRAKHGVKMATSPENEAGGRFARCGTCVENGRSHSSDVTYMFDFMAPEQRPRRAGVLISWPFQTGAGDTAKKRCCPL